MGLEEWKNKKIKLRYDDGTPQQGVREGTLLDVNEHELILQTATGQVAIPRGLLVRVELIGGAYA